MEKLWVCCGQSTLMRDEAELQLWLKQWQDTFCMILSSSLCVSLKEQRGALEPKSGKYEKLGQKERESFKVKDEVMNGTRLLTNKTVFCLHGSMTLLRTGTLSESASLSPSHRFDLWLSACKNLQLSADKIRTFDLKIQELASFSCLSRLNALLCMGTLDHCLCRESVHALDAFLENAMSYKFKASNFIFAVMIWAFVL